MIFQKIHNDNTSENFSVIKIIEPLKCQMRTEIRAHIFYLGAGGSILVDEWNKYIPLGQYCHNDEKGGEHHFLNVCDDYLKTVKYAPNVLPTKYIMVLTSISMICLIFSILAEIFLPSVEMTGIHRFILLCLMASLFSFYLTWMIIYFIQGPQETGFCKSLRKYI